MVLVLGDGHPEAEATRVDRFGEHQGPRDGERRLAGQWWAYLAMAGGEGMAVAAA